jgi:hypothetical protein
VSLVQRVLQFLLALVIAVGSYAAFGWGGLGFFAGGIIVGIIFAAGELRRRVQLRVVPDDMPAKTMVEEELPAYPADQADKSRDRLGTRY